MLPVKNFPKLCKLPCVFPAKFHIHASARSLSPEIFVFQLFYCDRVSSVARALFAAFHLCPSLHQKYFAFCASYRDHTRPARALFYRVLFCPFLGRKSPAFRTSHRGHTRPARAFIYYIMPFPCSTTAVFPHRCRQRGMVPGFCCKRPKTPVILLLTEIKEAPSWLPVRNLWNMSWSRSRAAGKSAIAKCSVNIWSMSTKSLVLLVCDNTVYVKMLGYDPGGNGRSRIRSTL